MALEVNRYDDLDGSPGAETVTFALDGKPYEIDLCHPNAQEFRSLFNRYVQKARPAIPDTGATVIYLPARLCHATGTLSLVAGSGWKDEAAWALPSNDDTFTGHPLDDRPVLEQVEASPTVPTQPTDSLVVVNEPQGKQPELEPAPKSSQPTDAQVREWARIWSVPDIPVRGRVPAALRSIYDAFHSDDRDPWKRLLKDNGINPTKAEAKAQAALTASTQEPSKPTQEEINLKLAKQVGALTEAQIHRLRLMFNAPDNCATSDGKSTDATSFEALRSRGCCTRIKQDGRRSVYEITDVGKLWFQARGVSTTDD